MPTFAGRSTNVHMNFKDQVVWITGASSGIGEHMAYAFAAAEAKLVLSSRNEQALEKVKEGCAQAADVFLLPLDVSDFDALPGKAQTIVDRYGRIDILINSAGISQRSLIRETDFSVDKRLMEVNYLGTVAATKAVLPAMLSQSSGHIVVISSVMGKMGVPWRSGYAASKHALHGYFEALRAELAEDNIAVTILIPGYVQSQVTVNALTGDGSKNMTVSDANRNGLHPADFARKALKAIRNGREEVCIGGKEIYAIYAKRFFPGLVSRMVKKVRLS